MKPVLVLFVALAAMQANLNADSIQFLSSYTNGPGVQTEMQSLANLSLDWTKASTGVCPSYCEINGTVRVGDNLSVAIFTPQNKAYIGPDGTSETFDYVTIGFSSPVAAVGLTMQDGYRFNWLVGLEVFDGTGLSLGKAEANGFAQVRAPATYEAAIAPSDEIWSVRLYTNPDALGSLFDMSNVDIQQAPEPAAWMLGAVGLALLVIGKARQS